MGSLFSWFGRKAGLFSLFFIAIFLSLWLGPFVSQGFNAARGENISFSELRRQIEEERDRAGKELNTAQVRAGTMSTDALNKRIDDRIKKRDAVIRRIEDREDDWFGAVFPQRIIALKKDQIELDLSEREIRLLEAALQPRDQLEKALEYLKANRTVPTKAYIARLRKNCTIARGKLREFEARWSADQWARQTLNGESTKLVAEKNRVCDPIKPAQERRERAAAAVEARKIANAKLNTLKAQAMPTAANYVAGVSQETPQALAIKAFHSALFAIALAIAVPVVWRFAAYYLLAPFAEKRPPLRFANPAQSSTVPLGGESRVSLEISLKENEEALARPDYHQTASPGAKVQRRLLLDWSNPITSYFSGMRMLTAFSGAGEKVVFSARSDPLVELALLVLPAGSAAIVRPSALAGLVQPLGNAVRMKNHCRVFSLHALLTWQFRYLEFQGPAKLVLKGGRGIRIETAGPGRIVSQSQLIGFSTDLAYSVIRTEVFLYYLFGREPLLKDRVDEGRGVLLVEEAPLAGKTGLKRGFEGAFDAFLKLFGI